MDDSLGDRQKIYESMEAQRHLMPLLPAMARLDGRSFSKFTKSMNRPYDIRMSSAMQETTKWLVEETNAICGYTQSDEISLVWYEPNNASQIFFNGRIQKMTSSLASLCTLFFNDYIRRELKEYCNKMPTFDARVWSVPTLEEAANVFLWRELDATKNAISMAAHHYLGHDKLQNKNGKEMQEMLWQQHGVNFNDFPSFFKRGMFFQKRTVLKKFDPTTDDLPEKHEARRNPDLVIERSEIRQLDMPPFVRVTNRVGVIFNGEDPQQAE